MRRSADGEHLHLGQGVAHLLHGGSGALPVVPWIHLHSSAGGVFPFSAEMIVVCMYVCYVMYLCYVCVSLCRVTGVLRGAAPCFFGYVGYDEVCCLSSEVADPKRTVPRAVFGTIFAVTEIYCLASIALVGMHDYRTLDLHSGFAGAFRLAITVIYKKSK